jgi:hypothetical protein
MKLVGEKKQQGQEDAVTTQQFTLLIQSQDHGAN